MDPKTPTTTPVPAPSGSLPPIEKLFSDSWVLFKNSLGKLLAFNFIMLGISVICLLLFFLVLAVLLGGSLLALFHGNSSAGTLGALGIGWGLILAIPVFLLVVIILGSVTQAGSIVVVNDPKSGIENALRKGFHFVLPLFLLSIVTFFLIIPPFFLFLIPGFFVVFFLYFAPYGVVVGGNGVLQSLRRSIYLVKSNFGAMFLRALLMVGVFFIIGILSSLISLATIQFGPLTILLGLVRFVASILAGWYVIAYSITLYKQAEAAAPDKKKGGRLLWFVLLSLISLFLVGLVVSTVVKAVKANPEVKNAFMQGFSQGYKTSTNSTNSSSNNSTDYMKQGYKTEFVKSCVQGGASTTTCTCIADYMINNYTTDELLQISQKYSQTKQIPQELTTAAQSCTAK